MKTFQEINYYNILGVSPFAAQDEIRKAYRKIVLTDRPEKAFNNAHLLSHKRLVKVNEAYNTLTNASTHNAYDACNPTIFLQQYIAEAIAREVASAKARKAVYYREFEHKRLVAEEKVKAKAAAEEKKRLRRASAFLALEKKLAEEPLKKELGATVVVVETKRGWSRLAKERMKGEMAEREERLKLEKVATAAATGDGACELEKTCPYSTNKPWLLLWRGRHPNRNASGNYFIQCFDDGFGDEEDEEGRESGVWWVSAM